MPTSFRPYDPDQSLLLPPSLRDWLAGDHLAYFVADTIDQLDLSEFYARYEGDGRRKQPYEPRMMVKVLVYAYATGTFSSRRVARRLEEDVAFRILGAGNFPAHRTICEFRRRHLEEFGRLFVQVVELARELKLVRLGTLAIDGSKVRANASKHKAMSYERMRQEEQRLKGEIKDLLSRAEAIDVVEDERYGTEQRGDELPEELARRESRLEQIRAAKRRLEARQRAEDAAAGREPGDDTKGGPGRAFKRPFGRPEDKKQENFTDPDSRIMKRGKNFEQSYNAQIAVDEHAHVIVAADVTQCAADTGQLLPMLDQVVTNIGETPARILADAGYRSESTLVALEERGVDGYIALGREGKDLATKTAESGPATARMGRKLRSPRGETRYRKRKWIAEPPFGWIKAALGFHRFSLRGLEKVRAEWRLVCLALNVRRLGDRVAWV
jgi:transposase/IS5 family transposase